MVPFSLFLTITVSFLLMLLPLPVFFVMLWRKKQFPVNSFFSGAAVFIVFYLMVRYYIISALGSSMQTTSVIAVFLSALIMEGGRYTGFLILPKKEGVREIKTGFSLAMGYMTAAFLLIKAFEMAMNFVYAGALEGWGFLSGYLERFPRESVDRVQMMIMETPGYTYLLEVLSLYLAVPVQLCLTLAVFESYRNEKQGLARWIFLIAAGAGNFLYFQLGSTLVALGWAVHLLYLAGAAGISLFFIQRSWKEEIIDSLGTA